MRRLAPAEVDPFARGFLGDPFAAYQSLHRAGALLWHPQLRLWLVPGHAMAREVLRDPAFPVIPLGGSMAKFGSHAGRDYPALRKVLDAVPFFNNPPAHAPMRRFVAAIFTAQPISAYAPMMREITQQLLARARAAGGFDAALDFADRLPPLFMARLLGVAAEDVPRLVEITAGVVGVFNRAMRMKEYEELERKAAASLEFFRRLTAERRRAPRDDGISRMLASTYGGRALGDTEIAAFASVTFLVGVETTTTLIGSAIRTLLENPAHYAGLRREPALLPAAVEEFLRCETPVQAITRSAEAPRELDGQSVAQGERLLVMLGAANRDPGVYPEPDRFDPRRAGAPHLAFADGPHVCVGATLARTETQVALDAFLRLPPLRRVAGAEEWWPYDWLRRIRRLPVEFA